MPHLTGPGTKNKSWWDDERDGYLRAHYRKGQVASIAAALGVTCKAAQQRAIEIGLSRPPACRIAWTPERLALLRSLYGVVPRADLAKRLGCTVGALVRQATSQQIRSPQNRGRVLDAAQRRYERACVILAWKMSLLSGPEAARALGTSQARLPEIATRLAMWGARQAEQGKEAAS